VGLGRGGVRQKASEEKNELQLKLANKYNSLSRDWKNGKEEIQNDRMLQTGMREGE